MTERTHFPASRSQALSYFLFKLEQHGGTGATNCGGPASQSGTIGGDGVYVFILAAGSNFFILHVTFYQTGKGRVGGDAMGL